VRCDATLAQAARLMQESNVRRLVVVDERGKIAGIVSRSDLLQVFMRTDDELRDEVLSTVIASVLVPVPERLEVSVRWNVVTLSGEVDRKSDAEILTRMTKELDGVVDVVDEMTYRWDDSMAASLRPVAIDRTLRAF